MSSICHRCASRLQRASQSSASSSGSQRTFSSTTRTQRTLPTFIQSTNHELNDVLSTLREKHFIPAALHKHERQLIFAQKFKQTLEDNPPPATHGTEEVPLKWINRRTEIPNRLKLVEKALSEIEAGGSQEWQNVPPLLIALKSLCKKPADEKMMEKIIVLARTTGHFGIIMQCLHQGDKTGMTLDQDLVLKQVLIGIREIPQLDKWSQKSMKQALRYVNGVAMMLESEKHGAGRSLVPNDPRSRPEVLGLYLELVALYIEKYEAGIDREDLVKTYAERLISQLDRRDLQPRDLDLTKDQSPMLLSIPVWHGLRVAKRILGEQLPLTEKAEQAMINYEAVLERLARQLQNRSSATGSNEANAVNMWSECSSD